MPYIITQSDCEFLRSYRPSGKVELRLQSILIKLGLGYRELLLKDFDGIIIDGVVQEKHHGKVTLGSAALGHLYEGNGSEDLSNIVPVLLTNGKLPQSIIPASIITDIYVYKEEGPKTWEEIIEWLRSDEASETSDGHSPEKGDMIIIVNDNDKRGAYFLGKDIEDETFSEHDFIHIPEPFGHTRFIEINGKILFAGDSETGDTITLGELLNDVKLSGEEGDALSITTEEDEDGNTILGSRIISIKDASDEQKGVVKVTDEPSEDDDSITVPSSSWAQKVDDKLIEIEEALPVISEHLSPAYESEDEDFVWTIENIDYAKSRQIVVFEGEERIYTHVSYPTETTVELTFVGAKTVSEGQFFVIIR